MWRRRGTVDDGGTVSITSGSSTASTGISGSVLLKTADNGGTGDSGGDISFVVPQTSTAGGTIGWGFSTSGVPYDGSASYDVRLTSDGASSMFVSNVPV